MAEKLEKSNVQEIIELSMVQKGMLYHYIKDADENTYNVQLSFSIIGDFKIDSLKEAFDLVQSRNEVLRSVFRWEGLNTPVQIILKDCPIDFSYHNLSQSTALEVSEFVEKTSVVDKEQRFDLTKLPLKIRVIKISQKEYVLNITNHHILYDGWSTGILLKEVFSTYSQISAGKEHNLKIKTSYKEVQKNILNTAQPEKLNAFWSNYLQDHETTSLFAHAKGGDGQVKKQKFTSSGVALADYAKTNQVTQASVIYAAYGILLRHYTMSSDVTFGTVVSNRNPAIDSINEVIGNFINTIPLRITELDNTSLTGVVKSVNKDLIERSDFSNISLSEVKEHLATKNDNLYDSIIAIENYPLDEEAIRGDNSLDIKLRSIYENTNFPLVITAFFGEVFEAEFVYKTDLVSDFFIKSLANNFISILETILGEGTQTVKELRLSLEPEEQELLQITNKTLALYPKTKTVMDLFQQQVEKTPNQTAVVYDNQKITYRELNELTDRIASFLNKKLKVKRNDLVAVMLERELHLIPIIFGIIKAGAAYVPIDPDFPESRKKSIIEDAGFKGLISRGKHLNPLTDDINGLVNLDLEWDEISAHEVESLKEQPSGSDLAYVIYTSGSTGKPKGVMIEHHAVVNRILWMQRKYPISTSDVLLQKTPIVFDVSVWELFWWSLTGASLCLLKPGEEKEPEKIVSAIKDQGVTTIHFVPSMLNTFLSVQEGSFSKDDLSGLRQVFVSGEALKPKLVNMFAQTIRKHSYTRLINLYGPTEATVDVSYYECLLEDEPNVIPIGKPIDNTSLHILSEEMNLVPIGVIGELHIAGAGLARGYLNRKTLTEQKFVENPFVKGERLYKTGDLARWLPDGNIAFLGRVDDQVKVRGFRIELGEVENKLTQHTEINEAVVLTREREDETYLVAYYLSTKPLETSELRDYLLGILPAYMVPSHFMQLQEFPLTNNGKTNKKLLPAPEYKKETTFIEASGKTEEILWNIWSEVLGHDSISTNQNFFDVGGDSLKLITVSSKVSKLLKYKVSVNDLFDHPTISQLASHIDRAQNGSGNQKKDHSKTSANKKRDKSPNGSSDIAIVGMAGRFPGAKNVNEFWENLKSGTDSISRETTESDKEDVIKAKGILEGNEFFEASFFNYTPEEAHQMDPQMRVFHECSWEALEDAGYNPYKFEGDIGMYAGASQNPYYTPRIAEDNPENWMDDWQSHIYSTQDYLSTRVSYKLNLTGPSVNIATACSTSLVAIDAACRDLLDGRCDMALSGGITLTFHDNGGYKYKKDMILSPDGYCRAFDKNAAGTVSGNGVGIVVLKKLADAQRDGDNIHAVIKGSAINNDGIDKVGFTAPSISGQTKVIQSAIRNANIHPESISYVETHGTGTLLGDPIELEGLKRAFASEKERFCAIGSVKSNFGHLNAAAGVTGLIKTVLSLKNKQIPPSLHFETPNEALGIEQSPFYVNNKLQNWQRNGTPRRAGISSFGIGGTNAHIILEEAPDKAGVSTSENSQLLLLSAKTQAALDRNMANLKSYLETNESEKIEDIAYTLNQGRAHFDYRKFITCKNRNEAIEQLASNAHSRGPVRHLEGQTVAFMFPGQGAQYHHMLLDLYQAQDDFKSVVDQCFKIVEKISGKDLKAIVFGNSDAPEKEDINNTEYTQPLLFIMEYAMARLLIKWGIQPDVMIGHSIGEYAAACISDVFSLEDALKLVVKRGELMQKLPKGSMLSIAAAEEDLNPFVAKADQISMAVVNSSESCVVSGNDHAIHEFQKLIEAEGYKCKQVQCSHAFHSAMMDDILGEFKKVVQSVNIKPQQIPFISNLTGTEANDQELKEADYWVRHLRETVRFSDGMETIMANKKAMFIEVGPGSILSGLVHSNKNKGAGHKAVNLARHPRDQKNDLKYLLSALGNLYLNGVELDWEAFYANKTLTKVSLPTYSFEKIKYPVKTQTTIGQHAGQENSLVRINDVSKWFYIPTWKMLPRFPNALISDQTACTLIFVDDYGLSEALVEKFRQNGELVICVKKGKSFKEESPTLYTVNPEAGEDIGKLFQLLKSNGVEADRIIHAWSVDQKDDETLSIQNHLRSSNIYFHSLIDIVKMVEKSRSNLKTKIVLLTSNLYSILGNEEIDIAKSMSTGLLKVISQEHPMMETSHIDMTFSEATHERLVDSLFKEITFSEAGKTVAFRNSRRWVQTFEQLKDQSSVNSKSSLIRSGGVYLITGGLGDLGYHLARHLVKTYQAKVVLTGRSQLPAQSELTRALHQADQVAHTKLKIERLLDLQQNGGEALYVSCDTSDLVAMQKSIEAAESQFGRLNGVIHAAGIVGADSKNFIESVTREDIDKQFFSKVTGTQVLREALEDRQLDFCILTSSLSTILGGLGYAAYASANAYMDHFAQASTNWLSVNFDGLNLNNEQGEGITPTEITETFDRLLSFVSLPQIAISVGDLNKRLDKWIYRTEAPKEEDKASTHTLVNENSLIPAVVVKAGTSLEERLLFLWQTFFGTTEIDLDDSFFGIGGDSLKALTMIDRIQKELGIELSIKDLFANPSVRELTDFIGESQEPKASEEVELSTNLTAISKAPIRDIYPLSSVQQRLYFLNEFDKGSLAYNMPLVMNLDGQLDSIRLKTTFNELGLRHESLRTFFDVVDGTPVQRILAGVDFKIEEFEANADQIESIITSFIRSFDLSRAPLMRVGLIKLSEQEHVLMVDMHHLINDGVSRGVLIRDFMALYNGEVLSPLQLQYKDYAEWQQSQEQEGAGSQKEFWLKEFANDLETLQLPVDFARPAVKSYVGDHVHLQLSTKVTEQLRAIADAEGATMFMLLLSAYNVLLSKLSLQEDIVVGTSTAGRHQQELEDIIGMFVKTVPLRNYPTSDLSFSEFLNNVKTQVISSFDNPSYSYEQLIDDLNLERDTSHNPLFDVLFSYENFSKTDFKLPNLTLKPYGYQHTDAKFDLTFTAEEKAGQLHLSINYGVDLFKKETVERFMQYFENIVTAITTNKKVKLKEIDILSDAERIRLLNDFNHTTVDYSDKDTLVSLFEKQAQLSPEKVAVVYENQSLTYSSLNEGANRLAGLLRTSYEVRPNDVVGIMVRRSEMMMKGLIGILKSGAAYLPIDPDLPPARVEDILKDSNTNVLITEAGLEQSFDYDGTVVYLEKDIDSSIGNTNLKQVNRSEDLCYMIYTSGSTGKPKGVMISHNNVMNFFKGMTDRIPTTEEDCMLAVTNTSFDISVLELFWTLCQGIEVVIHPSGTSLNNLDRYVSNKDVSMDFGIFFFSSYNNEGDDKYDLLIDAAKYADQAGFSAVWTPERHFHEFGGLFPNPSVLSSALAMITDQIELRSGSVVLPLHDEIRLVEEWSVVDNLSGGRVALSFAAGWNPNDFVLKNANYEERHKVMFEKIESVRHLWKGGSVSRENGLGKTLELNAFPVPVRPELPVWVTSGGGEETFKSAGAIGANLLTHLLGQDTEELGRKIKLYREAREANGFNAQEGKVALMLHTYVGEDIEEVERIVEQPFIEYLESSFALNKAIFEEEGVQQEEISEEVKAQIMKNAFKRYYKSSALIGTKNTCSEMILKLKQVGVDEIACLVDFGVEQELMMEGLKHLKGLKELHTGLTVEHHKPITMMQSTPSFVGHLNQDAGSQAFLHSLKTLLVGGEALPLSLVRGLKKETDTAIFNMYGPTETTIWSSVHEFTGEEEKVSIGKPIANTQIYILDKERQLVPLGVAGDLYIGGKGLSGEYWKRPDLTAQMFVENPFAKGEKIYKTGDTARWLSNGTLEFVGRTDYQVKLKGYRIELGEIEHSLIEYPAISEAIVTVRGEQDNERLVGYLVADKAVDFTELRAHVGKKLPHYMIPGDFVVLDNMPLTPNGKVNRKALPEPKTVPQGQYEAAQTDKEKLLLDVWSSVLNVENIGITDNFFAVGGDSIKSIQIISKVRNAGYEVSAKDIFISQTIQQLAPRLEEIVLQSDQSTLTGPSPLSPMQMWYFDQASKAPHHYNHAVMLNFASGISEETVSQIFGKIQEHHDALRTVFSNQKGESLAEIKGLDMPVSIVSHDLRNEQNPESAILSLANGVQASIDLSGGPLMKLGLFHMKDGTRLLIVIHHLVIDGISWRILFEDIEQLYQQIMDEKPLALPFKTDSFQAWPNQLYEYMNTSAYEKARDYWKSLAEQDFDQIQRDNPQGENTGHHSALAICTLELKHTQKLLTEVHEAFGTQINDILLVALFSALRKTHNLDRIIVDIEGHGREDLSTQVNISRTVGWFTSLYRVLLEGKQDDLAGYIKHIKEIVREVPNNGMDYLLTRYFESSIEKPENDTQSRSQLSFNYLGQFNTDTKGNVFDLMNEPVGDMVSPEASYTYDWDIVGKVIEDELEITLRYSTDQYKKENVDAFLSTYREALKEVIDYCCSYGKVELTPSDLTIKGISPEKLNELQGEYDIKDIYPLSATQESLLMYSVMDKTVGNFNIQSTCTLIGDIDIPTIEKTLKYLAERYDIIRTIFLHEGYEHPIQVVLKERDIDFKFLDIRDQFDKSSKKEIIREYQMSERADSRDLGKDSLSNLVVLQTGEKEYEFIWNYHHVLLDGWSMGILLGEFTKVYMSIANDEQVILPSVRPYAHYIQWLQNLEKGASEAYWNNYLLSYNNTVSLPQKEAGLLSGLPFDHGVVEMVLDKEHVEGLYRISREFGVTLNTIFQCSWALVLMRYNNVNDVVFGSVVGGRPAEIEGVEKMIGLFINTIPVRLSYDTEDTFSTFLKNIQAGALESEYHHHYPLAEVQSAHELGPDLLNHIVAFENFSTENPATGEDAEKPFETRNMGFFQQTNYDLDITVAPFDDFKVKFDFNQNRYQKETIDEIVSSLESIIVSVTNNPNSPIKDIPLLGADAALSIEEKYAIDLEKDLDLLPIQELLNNSFKAHSDHCALEYKGRSYSYSEIETQANKVAMALADQSIPEGSNIGIFCDDLHSIICSMLGILKTRMAFVPLEVSLPENRLSAMVDQAGINYIITDQEISASESLKVVENINWLTMDKVDQQDETSFTDEADYALMDTIYVYFTSGSTGVPKGVIGKNKSLSHFIDWEITEFEIDHSFRFSQFTNPGFDAFLRDVFVPLCAGATICKAGDEVMSSGQEIAQWIDEQKINLIHSVPSFFKLFQKNDLLASQLESLKFILLSGEKILPSELQDWYDKHRNRIQLVNLYGVTETTLIKGHYLIQPEDVQNSFIPVNAMPGAQFLILDSHLNLSPSGAIGEIYIRTPYRTAGYLNPNEPNSKSFIVNPFGKDKTDLIYKTGDLGRVGSTGELEILGRSDHQVKVRGIRIELDEIKENLLKYPGVSDAVVGTRESDEGDKFICAYLVSEDESYDKLQEFLSTVLPKSMVPTYFVSVPEFPLLPNGKINRKALAELSVESVTEHVGASTDTEHRLVEIWSEVSKMDLDSISITKSFFEMGAHSLKLLLFMNRINKHFNIKMPLQELFNRRNITQLAEYLSAMSQDEGEVSDEGEIIEITI